MGYRAVYMPDVNVESCKQLFDTYDLAWDWIKKHGLCSSCLKDLERGGYEYSFTDEEGEHTVFEEMDHPRETDCGAEWTVIEVEEIEELSFAAVLELAFTPCYVSENGIVDIEG